MRLVIPIFHTEFDALQVLFHWRVKIPPHGDFGDFWWLLWLFSPKTVDLDFQAILHNVAHNMGYHLAYSIPGVIFSFSFKSLCRTVLSEEQAKK